MAEVVIKEVTKKFGDFVAVNSIDLRVEDREFVVLVGPSGCGKTTTLRMVAGLEEVTAGEIYIGDRLVNNVPPKDRDIAMVFQNYALYPHMNVYNNMAFGLRLRKFPKKEIDRRVREAAELLGISDKLKSKPKELSGGQRQRVALGRAIVRSPKVFLFDEPLSNLDAKLRVQMRAELQKLHHELRTTTIYVTHDQVEAMTLGERVAVMKDGLLQQYDDPQRIYDHPVNAFVAGFIGSPAMNFLPAELAAHDSKVYVSSPGFKLLLPQERATRLKGYLGREVLFGIRPENLKALEMLPGCDPRAETVLEAQVRVREPLGDELIIYAETGGAELVARLDPRVRVEIGQPIKLVAEMEFSHIFDKETGETIV
ncbi:MAG: sn-glycerol-3-phosphate ABC transporter ATP-binding protein UgpC [Candidatus Acetothermia bacterium]|jgi:multiple sugar transport system ATP-binding protein|nr:sn-glycerol-3-phosphate ABC transporter ATP-binding protein UgpC [Candidatus Acetothermia bacterium]MDH7505892.1 sn-glycerol-3-phosphate ABC transporter ATP-binding protein UgpC [Candidatus Acetothermia bacterium]